MKCENNTNHYSRLKSETRKYATFTGMDMTENETKIKRNVGRPLGTKMIGRPPSPLVLKTDHQRIGELKKLLINGAGELVVNKAIEIALNDNHPSQAAMIKLCMDRTLPVSLFEKDKQQRSAVTINITGLGAVVEDAAVIDAAVIDAKDVTDV